MISLSNHSARHICLLLFLIITNTAGLRMFTRIASKCKTSSTSSSLLSSQFGSSSRLRSTSANFFEDLDPLLQRGLAALSVSSPTSFQTTAFSKIANTGEEKSDLVLSSETGSGKTLSYLLPILQNLLAAKTPSKYKTSTMIVVPNKEVGTKCPFAPSSFSF